MSYSDDLAAINTYMRTQPLTQPEAFQVKDAFIRWFDNLGWYDKQFTGQEVYDEARTRRNQLNIANQPTPAAKDAIRAQLATGIETEEMQGKPKPAFDPATGRVGTQVKKPTVQPTPSTMPNTATPSIPNPVTGKPRPTLTIGSRGPDVNDWQTFVGISPVTGYYGESTAGKTKNWQKANGLTADGKVGPLTWAKAFPGTATAQPATNFAPAPVAPFAPSPNKPKAASTKPAQPAQPAQPVKPTAKAKAAAKKASAAVINEAGFLNISKWPLWVKVGAAATVISGIGAALLGHKPPHLLGNDRHR